VTTTPNVEDTAVPASVTESDDFPEGVYRHHISVEDFLDAGLDRGDAISRAGMWELNMAAARGRSSP
jgi:hypothetical protein